MRVLPLSAPADERDYDRTDYSLSQVGTKSKFEYRVVLCACVCSSAAAEALTVRVSEG